MSSLSIGALARIAWRDLRGSRTAALIILACLTLGVATITGIGSLRESVTQTVERDARTLLGGDVVIEFDQPHDPGGRARADRAGGRHAQPPGDHQRHCVRR